MIKTILQDIVRAKNNHAYALAMALTLQNILSNIEYGQETHKDKYIEWYDKWVYKYYKHPMSENEFINKSIEFTKFDGKNCYLLRCALLHSGNTDLKNKKGEKEIDQFELCVSEISPRCGDSYICTVSNEGISNVCVSLNVIGLINSLVLGAEEYIHENQDKILQSEDTEFPQKTYGGISINIL